MKIDRQKIICFVTLLFLSFNVCTPALDNCDIQISKIEKSIWGFEYLKDDTQKRLSRIEKNIFGTTFQKSTKEERIKKINDAMGFESFEDSLKQGYELAEAKEEEGINYPQIDALEYQIFSSTYEKENIYKRLERLEKKIFGSKQDGNLASRTDRLKAYIRKDMLSQNNPAYYTQKPYNPTETVEPYMNSQGRYENSDIHIQLAGLETTLFSKTFSQDPVGLRLNRLERKIFQRDFSSDDEYLRLQRLQAAANAKQTAKLYEANKIQKYTSTGFQLGSIILMILALIL